MPRQSSAIGPRTDRQPGARSLKGTVTFDKNVTKTINQAIDAIDAAMSKQLAAIMHHPDFQKLEGTLARAALPGDEHRDQRQAEDQGAQRPEAELFKDLDKAVEFDQSQIFKKLYENEFGTPGGEPYGALIGDYEFTNHPEDIDLLGEDVATWRRRRSARSSRPPTPKLFGFDKLDRAVQAARPGKDLRHGRIHQVEVVPRLGRLALRHAGHAARAVAPALRREHQADRGVRLRGGRARLQDGKAKPVPHDHYCLDERRPTCWARS